MIIDGIDIDWIGWIGVFWWYIWESIGELNVWFLDIAAVLVKGMIFTGTTYVLVRTARMFNNNNNNNRVEKWINKLGLIGDDYHIFNWVRESDQILSKMLYLTIAHLDHEDMDLEYGSMAHSHPCMGMECVCIVLAHACLQRGDMQHLLLECIFLKKPRNKYKIQ